MSLLSPRVEQQLENLSCFLLCIARSLVYGKANRIPAKIERVLVIPPGHLGDIVCNTQVFTALRNSLPNAHLMCQDPTGMNTELLAESGLVDEFVSFRSWKETVRAVRRARPDVVLITSPYYVGLAGSYLAGARCIVIPRVTNGSSPVETRTYKILSHLAITVPCSFGTYAPRDRLRVLEPLGIHTEDTTKHLGFSKEDRAASDELLATAGLPPEQKFVCVSFGSGNKIKRWPPERFARVMEHIAKKYSLPIVLIGTEIDREEADEVFAIVNADTNIINMISKFSIGLTKATIARASLFISVDTGPIYIAEAFGVPTIDIVGPVDAREQPPVGPKNIIIEPKDLGPAEVHILNARVYDVKKARAQAEAITVQQVTDAVDSLLQSYA